jgi:Ca2+/H+ antiporter, TMEM165/GDT1 family
LESGQRRPLGVGRMYRVNKQTGQGFKAHDRQFQSMRSAWAGGLHLRSRTDEWRGAGTEVNTIRQSALIHDGYERTWHATPDLTRTQTRGRVEAFLVSMGVVALAEIGDKTQLLALVLAARFRAPIPVIMGILVATLANHLAAGAVGTALAAYISPVIMRWAVALSFFGTALWMFIPDKQRQGEGAASRFGAFGTTVLSFFLAEIGDKTQIATVALAANYRNLLPVVCGTTLGMLLANVPVVLLGGAAATRIPLNLVHRIAAAAFVVLGILTLLGHGGFG